MITKELWEAHRPKQNPFLRFEFMDSLRKSGSIGIESGWQENSIHTNDGILLNFVKTHSYGEYIFDWAWAEAYERYGVPYYPKTTSMIPFTPVTTPHFLMKSFNHGKAKLLLRKHDESFIRHPYSSAHFLFLTTEEIPVFEEEGYLLRESMQYHFFNQGYETFEDFLSELKGKKAKTIRQERVFPGLEIRRYTGDSLKAHHGVRMYDYYIQTIANKNSFDYLNRDFFEMIFESFRDNILFIEASLNGEPIAGSLFFFDEAKLYGRYWGSMRYQHNLHFELCYYQGIDFCIEKKLSVFEAGAQGEHKIARGFRPVRTYSAHKLKEPAFHEAIRNFIGQEKKAVAVNIERLSEYLPFK